MIWNRKKNVKKKEEKTKQNYLIPQTAIYSSWIRDTKSQK